MRNNPVLGEGECHECGGPVTVKLSVKDRAYYFCNDCPVEHKFGRKMTNHYVQQARETDGNTSEETGTAEASEAGTGDGTASAGNGLAGAFANL